MNNSLLYELLHDYTGDQFEKDAYELIARHRLFPMAKELINFSELKEKEKWESAIRNNTVKSMHYTGMLINLLNKFCQHNVQIIPFKGPILALSLYGDVGKRQFVDLDLLVRKEEIELTIQIAKEMGYSLLYPNVGLSVRKWKYYFEWKNDVVLYHKKEGISVELHVGIFYHKLLPRRFENIFFRDLIKESIGGISIDSLNRNNTFLYLAFHGAYHQYSLLFWLRDFSDALQKWELDHTLILENARNIGIERMLGVSLILARKFFKIKIPQTYKTFLEEESVIIAKLTKLCYKRILGGKELNLIGRFRRVQYYQSLKPGINYKLSVLTSVIHHWYIRKFMGGQ